MQNLLVTEGSLYEDLLILCRWMSKLAWVMA